MVRRAAWVFPDCRLSSFPWDPWGPDRRDLSRPEVSGLARAGPLLPCRWRPRAGAGGGAGLAPLRRSCDRGRAQVPTLGPAEPQARGGRTPPLRREGARGIRVKTENTHLPRAVQSPAWWPVQRWYSTVRWVLVPPLTAWGPQDKSLVSLFAHPKKWVIPPTS